jgi:hypothetical protein
VIVCSTEYGTPVRKAVSNKVRRRAGIQRFITERGWRLHQKHNAGTGGDDISNVVATREYRKAWRARMDEVNACMAAIVEQEELLDQPEVAKGMLRVNGPFTVEAVQPPEMTLGDAHIVALHGTTLECGSEAAAFDGSLRRSPPRKDAGEKGGSSASYAAALQGRYA